MYLHEDASDVIVLHQATIPMNLDVNFRHTLNAYITLHKKCAIKFNVIKRYERNGSATPVINRLLHFTLLCNTDYT